MNMVRFRQSGTFASWEGLLRCEGGRLHLEYQLVVLGAFKGGVKQAEIALADLVSAELVWTWSYGYKMLLQAKTMEAVREVPGMSQGRIEFLIARADRAAARQLIDSFRKPGSTDEFGLEV